jgi:hypothetical protein
VKQRTRRERAREDGGDQGYSRPLQRCYRVKGREEKGPRAACPMSEPGPSKPLGIVGVGALKLTWCACGRYSVYSTQKPTQDRQVPLIWHFVLRGFLYLSIGDMNILSRWSEVGGGKPKPGVASILPSYMDNKVEPGK